MATATFTGSKGHHTFTVTVEPVSTIPSVANTAYAYVTMTMYGGSYDFNYSSKSVSWSLNVGGYMFSGSFGTYTANTTLTLVSRQQVTIDVSGGDTSVTLNVTDGIGASYSPGDVSEDTYLDNFTSYYFTSVGKPGKPIISQNSDGSLLFKVAIGSGGTNNTANDVHVYYRWGNSTVSSSTYDGSINLTYNSTSTYYEGTIAASTVIAKNTKSIYAVAYTIGQRSNSSASDVASKTDVWSWTGVGEPTNVSVQYLATQNKFRVTGNAGTSGTNNAVTGIMWCWEVNGMDDGGAYPYTWHGKYTTATENNNRGTISCSAGASFSFDIPLANKNTTHYTFVVYTQGSKNNNYGGDYAGIHVIRNAYSGNYISGMDTRNYTVHNISYGYTSYIEDFSCYRINQEYTNAYDYYVTAGTSTIGINICGIGYEIKYFADEAMSDLITRDSHVDYCSAGEFIGGRFYYPDVSVNHVYVLIEMYTLYDNDGGPSAIGPMSTYEMEMKRYTPCISPKLIFPNPETSIEKFIPFTGTSCTIPITFGNAENGDNNPITSFKVELINYNTDDVLATIPVELEDLLPATQRTVTAGLTHIHKMVGNGGPLLIRVLACSDEWGEMWFPTDSPMLDNGEYANQVILYIYETGYVYQKVGTQQQQGFVYTKVNGSWKLATPDILSKVSGSWKGTPDTSIPTTVYDK